MAESGLIRRENPLLCLTKGLIPSGTRFFNVLHFSSAAKEKDLMILGWNDHKCPKSLLLEAKGRMRPNVVPQLSADMKWNRCPEIHIIIPPLWYENVCSSINLPYVNDSDAQRKTHPSWVRFTINPAWWIISDSLMK